MPEGFPELFPKNRNADGCWLCIFFAARGIYCRQLIYYPTPANVIDGTTGCADGRGLAPPAEARSLDPPNTGGRVYEFDVNWSQPPRKTSGPPLTLNAAARRATAGSWSSTLGRYVEALSIDADWRAGIVPGRPLTAHHDGLNSKTHSTAARRQRRGVAANQPTAAASRKSVEGAQVKRRGPRR